MKILIVEDDFIVRTYLQFQVKKLASRFKEFEYRAAAHLVEAYKIMENFTPDVITLDLNLGPEQSVETVMAHIPNLAKIATVVVVSGTLDQEEGRRRALSMGAQDFVPKEWMNKGYFLDRVISAYYRHQYLKWNATPEPLPPLDARD